jgi:exosortase E/protease (VPEID-CTERM system)
MAGVVATVVMQWSEQLWEPTARVTFYLAAQVLRPLIPALITDPAALIFRANHFAVQIAEACSGLEGVGLMSVFCGAWLLFFRHEYRFPRALALIPIGLVLVFLLNIIRIAALVLIGNAGYPDVAIYGFHSQAGWIGFNLAAAGVLVISRHIRWWQYRPSVSRAHGENPTAAYVMPFLAVIAAGILARSLSSGFELWYGLRLIAGLALLFVYRERLTQLVWNFGWHAIAAGILAFAIWFVAAHWLLAPAAAPEALLSLTPMQRTGWLAARIVTAVLLVPVVEELAFRGFLARRLLATDFEAVPFTSVGWPAIAVSSIAFGALHGAMWLPGVLVGTLYGLLLRNTGRIGEPVAAHAITNGLVACCVLGAGQWQLW